MLMQKTLTCEKQCLAFSPIGHSPELWTRLPARWRVVTLVIHEVPSRMGKLDTEIFASVRDAASDRIGAVCQFGAPHSRCPFPKWICLRHQLASASRPTSSF